jgi:glycine cleavage system aminomethyltransferase T
MAGIVGFTLFVARDDAEYLWEALLLLGRPHGLAPVGGATPGIALERMP